MYEKSQSKSRLGSFRVHDPIEGYSHTYQFILEDKYRINIQ